MRKLQVLALALIVLLRPDARAQQRLPLTIDTIMRGPNFYGFVPQDLRWSGDNERLYFTWKQAEDNPESPRDTYMLYRTKGVPIKLSDDDTRLAPPPAATLTKDHKRGVYVQNGDIYLYDYTTDKARALTKTADAEKSPHFTKDEKRVAFTRDGNLYLMAIDTGLVEQFTELVPNGSKAAPPKPADENKKIETSQDFLVKQEKELIAAVREKERLKAAEEGRKKREHPRQPFELGPRQIVSNLLLCPDETCAIAMIDEAPKDAKNDNVPNYVTASGYTEEIPGRTNVGDQLPHALMLVLDAETGAGKWFDPNLGGRAVTLTTPIFNDRGSQSVLVARAIDNKDRWILALDTANAHARVLFTEHDDAWLGGPGEETLGWLKNNDDIYFQSERDGWSHLYTVSSAGGTPKQLTSGKFEVQGVELANDGSKFYLTTNEGGPNEHHLYSMNVTGGARTRLTTETGGHDVTLSRDQRYWADLYSYANKPPEIYIAENKAGAKGEKRTDSPARDFQQYPWQDPPLVQVPARDGAMLPGRFFKPANYQPGGPAVIFVHGAGYLQNVHKFWSPYPREFLFHHFLVEHGYMVLDLDYRASSGYGRDWRTGIYRFMGGKDLEDNLDGAKWLITQGADARRIGIYGGSYGGFITLMAMFTQPDVFAAGAALRPVTDWSHYNHEYTSNILNVPQEDAEAYRKSSPIYFAEGLKGALLICHGMVDTNVFFQDTVRLVQRLIELRKENWSVAMYPVEDHGFVKASSWSDEYKRIFQLFETNLKKPL